MRRSVYVSLSVVTLCQCCCR